MMLMRPPPRRWGSCGSVKEIEKFIIRQPPTGEKDNYDSENSWISDGLPSSSSQSKFFNLRGVTSARGVRNIKIKKRKVRSASYLSLSAEFPELCAREETLSQPFVDPIHNAGRGPVWSLFVCSCSRKVNFWQFLTRGDELLCGKNIIDPRMKWVHFWRDSWFCGVAKNYQDGQLQTVGTIDLGIARSVEDETRNGHRNEKRNPNRNHETIALGLFHLKIWPEPWNGSFLISFRISICIPITISSLIFHGTGCTNSWAHKWVWLGNRENPSEPTSCHNAPPEPAVRIFTVE